MTAREWQEIDPECRCLVKALNQIEGIKTFESCCGHDKRPFGIWVSAETFESLSRVAYWLDPCHCGCKGWSLLVQTDCGMRRPTFLVNGPVGAYGDADRIATVIAENARQKE